MIGNQIRRNGRGRGFRETLSTRKGQRVRNRIAGLVIALGAAFSVVSLDGQTQGFRQSPWGDTRQAVISKEGTDYVSSGNSLYYKRRIAGVFAEVEYGFDPNDHLQIGVYRFNSDPHGYMLKFAEAEALSSNQMLKLADALHASLAAQYPPSIGKESEDSHKEPVILQWNWELQNGAFVSLALWRPDLEPLQLRINVDFFAPGGPLPNRRPYGPFSPSPPKDNY